MRVHRVGPGILGTSEAEPPELPGADASRDEIVRFLKASTSFVTAEFERLGLRAPEGAVFAYDPASGAIASRLPEASQRTLRKVMATMSPSPTTLAFDLHIIEAPGERIRDVIEQAAERWDHRKLLDSLLAEADAGDAVAVADTAYIETRSGQPARIARAEYASAPTDIAITESGFSSYNSKSFPSGLLFEIDPIMGPDGETIDVNLKLDYAFAPPAVHEEVFAVTPHGPVSAVFRDRVGTSLETSTTLSAGSSKLIGAWTPAAAGGHPGEGYTLQAAFLSVELSANASETKRPLGSWIELHGDSVAKPNVDPVMAETTAEDLLSIRTPIPHHWLAMIPKDTVGEEDVDPFAPLEPFAVDNFSSAIADALGMAERAILYYSLADGIFVVQGTREDLDKFKGWINSTRISEPHTLAVSIQIVQTEAQRLRRLSNENGRFGDHGATSNEIVAAAARGEASILRTATIETRSGQPARLQAGQEFSYPKAVSLGLVAEEHENENSTAQSQPSGRVGTLQCEQANEFIGLRLEIDPVISPDNRTLDYNIALEYDYGAPQRDIPSGLGPDGGRAIDPAPPTFRRTRLSSSVTSLDGTTRTVGMWQPGAIPAAAGGDVVQAALLRIDILRAPLVLPTID